jgi:hypothetical protein
MESFKSFIQEARLSRVFQYVEDPSKGFGIVSAFRGQYSNDENMKRHADLKKTVRGMGLGFVEMKGGYKEEGGYVEELSLFVPKATRDQIITLGKKYDQHSVMFKDDKEFVYIGTNESAGVGKVLSRFKAAEGRDNIELAKEKVADFFSQLKKGSHKDKKFLFNMRPTPGEDEEGKDRVSKKPGDVWQTEGGNWGGKNRRGKLDYFSDERKAQEFAKSMGESFELYEMEEWSFGKAAYLNRGKQPQWIQII